MKNNSIYVTQPFLPPLEEFQEYLKNIWESKRLTNGARYHQEFEEALCNYLGVKYISLFTNGTLALITALQALDITGEVITTPFSFVATAHSLLWNGITPVFCDIESDNLNIDPNKIEDAITSKTTAILPVHVYGNPCDVIKIQEIAEKHNLKIIYDAAHAFGVNINEESILNFGDLSILSFHATKVFNTFEGGAIVCHDADTKRNIDYLKNFGFASEINVIKPGINAKMNEFQAALGILQLKYIDYVILKRKDIVDHYRSLLKNISGLTYLNNMPNVRHNFNYFPILVENEKFGKTRNDVYEELKKHDIYTRRYFYPLISQFPPYKEQPSGQALNLPVAERITEQVLCLPLYSELDKENITRICSLIKDLQWK